VPRKPATRCGGCHKVIKKVPIGNGWAHKSKAHWKDKPHKAIPEVTADAVS